MPLGSTSDWDLVGSRFSNHVRGTEQRFECPRIGPPSVQDAVCQRTFLQIHIIYIRDFEFVASARFGLADLGKHRRIVKINSGDRELGLGRLWFFFNFHNFAVRDFGASKAFRIDNFLEYDMSTRGLLLERVLGGDDVLFNDVVAEHDANFLSFDDRLREPKGVSNTSFTLLVGIVNAMKLEIFAIGEQAEKIA